MKTSVSCGFLALLIGIMPMVASAAMPPQAYEGAVTSLAAARIIDGYASGDPRLYDPLSRAEAVKILVNSQGQYASTVASVAAAMPPIPLFSDVDQREWYAPYLEVAFKHGLVKGYADGNFRPRSAVRVSEAVTLLVRAFGQMQGGEFQSSADLPNVEGQWFTGAVSSLLAQNGVMPGSRLSLSRPITRGEFFDMVYRMRSARGQTSTAASRVPTPVLTLTSSAPSYVPPPSTQPAPQTSASPKSQKPFAISIPRLGINDLTVTHPEDPSTQKGVLAPLKDGVGHLFGYPGDGGKILIYGHSSSYPWDISPYTKIFRTINTIAIGDAVYVTRNGKLFTYTVTDRRTVPAKERSVFEPDDEGEELILYTCWPPDSITNRFLVIAKPANAMAAR